MPQREEDAENESGEYTYREIGEQLGVSTQVVYQTVHGDSTHESAIRKLWRKHIVRRTMAILVVVQTSTLVGWLVFCWAILRAASRDE